MRIQHNILAMNAYRNYNTNTSALAKNLEKLSSGYKINRAGDDAAGLAISEKMRAQITGLSAAQKNVKDGISLVKTAEGAMQEIQDMLNRMDYLATQSANGTYDDPVDRKNLQAELDALRTEINRIADSSNFNGINLLDGSLTAGGKSIVALSDSNAIQDSLVDGINPSAAGKAEITVTLGEAAKATAGALEKTGGVNGQLPTNATSTVIKISLPASGGTDLTINGNDYNGDSKVKDIGEIAVGGKTIADLFNLCTDTSGTISNKGKDAVSGLTDWTNNSDAVLGAAGDIYLVAKNPGDMGATINAALDALGGIAGVEVTKGIDVGDGATQVNPEYNFQVDLSKLAGGQVLEINGKKLLITEDGSTSVPSGSGYDAVFDLTAYNRKDDGDVANAANTAVWTGKTGSQGQMASDLQAKLSTMLSGKYNVDAVDKANYNAGKYTFHLVGTAGADSVMQEKSFTIDGDSTTNGGNGNTPLLGTISETVAYVPQGAAKPGLHASATYGGFDVNKLTAGSKVVFGGTVDATGTATGGQTFEIVEKQTDQDLANGKVWLGDCTNAAQKAAKLEMAYKTRNKTGNYGMKIDTAANTITLTKNTLDATTSADLDTALANGNSAVSVYTPAGGGFTATGKGNGTTPDGLEIEVGTTTVADLKNMVLSNGKKVSDLFDVDVKDGNTSKNGASDVIDQGYTVKFTAKTAARLDDSIMNDLNFDTSDNAANKVSQIVKDGYDEGTGGAAKKTHYDLTFDLSTNKLTGGQSFSFGTDSGKTYTFDLSFDQEPTQNGTTLDGETNNEVGKDRITIYLGDIATTDSKAMFDKIKEKVAEKMGADFSVTGQDLTGGQYKMNLDAKVATDDTNLGQVRYSSASGGIVGGTYTPSVKSSTGDMGVYAQASWNFDLGKLSKGDTITIGGATVNVGEKTTTTVDASGNVESVTLSVADAQNADKLVAAFEKAGFNMGKLAFAGKKLTITDSQTGRTGQQLADAVKGAGISVTASAERKPTGLTLQIGDTSDDFNQLNVSIGDMHTSAMGTEGGTSIADIDISNQQNAQSAIQTIKDAINYVSGIRGDLGATQNRLEHTANNLSVMAENIQDAESTIRDTDVAEEMMAYTKNNILVQSAQAMLAQANAVPQGVLQLLG